MKNYRKFQLVVPVLALILSTIACGSSNTGEKIATSAPIIPTEQEATQEPTTEAQSTATPARSIFTVGDIIAVEDQTIVINSIDYTNGIIKANILVENNGTSDVNISSMLSFSAKLDDGTVLDQEIFDCGTAFDGSILPGDRLLGDICYTLPAPGIFKIYYEADLFSSGATVWQFDANNLPVAAAVPTPKAIDLNNTYAVGDVVSLPGQTVTLNNFSITNDVLMANFTVENTGTEDINVSSMMSFTAKAPDGTLLEQNIFDCGSAMDGSVLPGDKLKGDICYDVAGASPIKLYYTANMFSEGAVVWIVE